MDKVLLHLIVQDPHYTLVPVGSNEEVEKVAQPPVGNKRRRCKVSGSGSVA